MRKEAARSLRAETVKLLSLPSAHLTVLGTLGASVVLALAFAAAGRRGNAGTTSGLDIGLAPVGYTQAGFIVLGVIAVTSEYDGGQINTTLTAMPRRITLHLTKLLALSLYTTVAAASSVLAGVAVAATASGDAPALTAVPGAVGGACAYLVLTALLSAAVATVVRHSIAALTGLLCHYFIAGPLLRDRAAFATYLPDTAGYSMWFQGGAGRGGALSVFGGTAVLVGWSVVAVAVAAVTFLRRDA